MTRPFRPSIAGFLGIALLVACVWPAAAQQLFETKAAQAFMIDAETGTVLFSKDADKLIQPASLAKLMTMEVAFNAVKTGRLKLDDTFVVSEHAWRTGGAASGESEIRRHVLENDLVEAIIALPTDMFFNTGIATYIWVLSNRKPSARKGLVQLIDASSLWRKMRKSLGSKRREMGEADIDLVARLFGAAAEAQLATVTAADGTTTSRQNTALADASQGFDDNLSHGFRIKPGHAAKPNIYGGLSRSEKGRKCRIWPPVLIVVEEPVARDVHALGPVPRHRQNMRAVGIQRCHWPERPNRSGLESEFRHTPFGDHAPEDRLAAPGHEAMGHAVQGPKRLEGY